MKDVKGNLTKVIFSRKMQDLIENGSASQFN